MKTPLAVLTADCHLQDRAWANYRELRGDALFGFEQLVDIALERELPLIAAGDLLDRPRNDSRVPDFLRRQLSRLARAKLPFYYIQGQDTHDRQVGTPWASAVSSWAKHIHGRTVELAGTRVYGLDWQPRHELPAALAGIPADTEVLVMHQVTLQLMRLNYELDVAQVPHASVLVVGDYHEQVVKKVHGNDGQPLVLYSPGGTCLQAKDEVEHKSCGVLHRDGDKFTIELVPLRTRPVVRGPEVVFENELDEYIARIGPRIEQAIESAADLPDHLRKPLVEMKFNGRLEGAYQRIRAAVGDKAFLMAGWLPDTRPEDKTVEAVEYDQDEDGQPYTLLDALDDRPLDKEGDVYQLARALLSGRPLQETLTEYRRKMGLS